jgi:hypothetical protein
MVIFMDKFCSQIVKGAPAYNRCTNHIASDSMKYTDRMYEKNSITHYVFTFR